MTTTDTAAPAFEREERYIVIKIAHLTDAHDRFLREWLYLTGVQSIESVVIESDWPEYEPVWRMLADRLTGQTTIIPVRNTPSPYAAGNCWKEPEGDCWTSEVQLVGGDYVVATVHGETETQAIERRDAVLAILDGFPRLADHFPDPRKMMDVAATSAVVDQIAARMAKSDGLDWAETCAFEEDLDNCASGTCIAAHDEDHDPEACRDHYRKYARVALGMRRAGA
ncbi:hypothetical protein [Sphingomonas sp. Leaf4]|uniref:hypothetical protein n=1 Tax=Sphingomonas sp. Leaf4 TaxID=2876553 RepID=UPI001E42DF80|nr:hypothetical protein [Sphingomonas sp. Leaf4]